MYYRRLTRGLKDRGVLIEDGADVYSILDTPDQDAYLSTFKYTEDQKKIFEEKHSVAGIEDVITNMLWWDFDSEDNLEAARLDAQTLVARLLHYYPEEAIQITFSGNRGFGVVVHTQQDLTKLQATQIAYDKAKDLSTFDNTIYLYTQILRIPFTKHLTSGLYKTPLSWTDLRTMNVEEIQFKAQDIEFQPLVNVPVDVTTLAPNYQTIQPILKVVPKTEVTTDHPEIDFSHKIKGWPNCKWALAQGYGIKSEDRHSKLLCIIAQAKFLNYPKQLAYYTAKNADEIGSAYYDCERHNKDDLWKKVEEVYSDKWRGGTFSCKDGKTLWLTEICNSLGQHKCKHEQKTSYVEVGDVFAEFRQFAQDIEKHTIKTGIEDLDRNLRFRTGQMIGILGAPSSGKTSLALELLENTSNQGLLSVFYSLDMSSSELFQKIAQRVTKLEDSELYKILQTDPKRSDKIRQQVEDAYKNVKFCFDTGVSVDKIQESIIDFEEQTNQKVKLLLLDYNELLSSPYSDATAASGYNAGALKKLTNLNQLCTISLLQPPKVIGDASDPIISYRNIKGSSLLEQTFSTILGIYRPGFTPENDSVEDLFLIMNVLKNRLGRLFSLEFTWNGVQGKIGKIQSEADFKMLEALKEKKLREKTSYNDGL